MAQDSLYFPHDYDPFSDLKFKAFVIKHKAQGYAVFWRLIELLHQNKDHHLEFNEFLYSSIEAELNVSIAEIEQIMEDCINKYHLFQSDGIIFWSERVMKNIKIRKDISAKRSKAGLASAEQRKKDKEAVEYATQP